MSKLLPYPTYQPIKYDYVSQLPEGWKLLPNIAVFKERKEKGGLEMESLSVSAIKGIVKAADYEDRKDRTSDDKSEYLVVHKGDIPYNTMLMWAGAVGRSDYEGIVSPAYTVLQPKSKVEINTKYFHFMFRSQFYKDYSKRFSYGIVDSRLRLYYTYFKRMYSIVPPIETQNAIVAYLDRKTQQIQEFIAKKERLIELLEEQIKSIILDECNDAFLNYRKKIKYVAKICNGQDQKNVERIEGKYAIYGSGGIIGRTNQYLHNRPSVLLGRKGTIDKPIFVKEPFWSIDTAFYTIINEKVMMPEYFYYASSFIPFEKFTYGSAIPSMTQGILNNIEIPLPTIETQTQIINSIKKRHEVVRGFISKAKIEIEKAKEYRESLITQIVTGQLKVPEKANSNLEQNIELGMVAELNSAYHSTK